VTFDADTSFLYLRWSVIKVLPVTPLVDSNGHPYFEHQISFLHANFGVDEVKVRANNDQMNTGDAWHDAGGSFTSTDGNMSCASTTSLSGETSTVNLRCQLDDWETTEQFETHIYMQIAGRGIRTLTQSEYKYTPGSGWSATADSTSP
jgi:hypothetical protein